LEVYIRDNRNKGKRKQGPRVNDYIRISECRLTGEDGHEYGVVSMSDAKEISREKGLDLVEVSPNAKPPVVKLIDYGKFKYDQQKKANEAKKKQVTTQLKEIQFRPNIEAHDLTTKLNRGEKFLGQGDKVKMVMQFRGREMAYRDKGMEKFRSIIARVLEMGAIVESDPKMMGNRIITIVAPDKKKMKHIQDEKKAANKAANRAAKAEKEAKAGAKVGATTEEKHREEVKAEEKKEGQEAQI
jgi:translation initiation factor IF-3